jgi:hypothetical protein
MLWKHLDYLHMHLFIVYLQNLQVSSVRSGDLPRAQHSSWHVVVLRKCLWRKGKKEGRRVGWKKDHGAWGLRLETIGVCVIDAVGTLCHRLLSHF